MVQPPEKDSSPAPDQRLVRALDHPVRVGFLRLLAKRETITPQEALPLLSRKSLALSNVAYHAGVLEHLELIEPTGEPGPSGGPIFRATPKGEDALMSLGLSGS
jgi:Helix-turn-helix domain